MQKVITAIVVVVLLAVVVILNFQLNKANPVEKGDDDHDQDQSQEAKKPAAPPQTASGSYIYNTKTTGATAEADEGVPTAPTTISIGYTWTPALSANQDALKGILSSAEAWAKQPNHHLQIVCVDIPVDERQFPGSSFVQTGVYLNGKPAPGLSGNPGETITEPTFETFLAGQK